MSGRIEAKRWEKLTVKEAQTAIALCKSIASGEDREILARSLQVSPGRLNNILASIYRKLEINRQGELIMAIQRLKKRPPNMRGEAA